MLHHLSYVSVSLCLLHFLYCASKSSHPGHLKPFGSIGPFEQIEKTTDGFLDPSVFFENYVFKSRPIVFRQVLAGDPHLSLWKTDENIYEIFKDSDDKVHVETRKKESRQQDILSMTMKDFLKRYQKEELYLVEEVPNLLRPYFTLPKSLQCKPALDTFQIAMMWFSSGNTSSVVHTDDYDNINCVLQGDKQFILIDPHKYPEVADQIIDNPSGSYSSVDVDRVDYKKYSSLANPDMQYYQLTMHPGDCLFLPALWIHQVRSTHRNIAVNYWLDHQRAKNAQIDPQLCTNVNPEEFLTLETIHWPTVANNIEQLKDFMLDLVDDDSTSFKQWTREFSKEFGFDLQSNVQTISWFAEFFHLVDGNDNGYVTDQEIESLFDSENGTVAHDILQNVLDIVEKKVGKRTEINDTMIESNEEEITYDNYYLNETTTSDDETNQDDYLLEHDDL